MRLQAEAPLRMGLAVADCQFGVREAGRAVHGLQKEIAERESREFFRVGARLRKDQLQFVAGALNEFCIGLWADADPVQALRGGDGAVGFYGDFKIYGVQRIDQRRIELQQGFAACADDEGLSACVGGPLRCDCGG